MSGRPGRNVAWDYVLEKMNLAFKQYLQNHITDERLREFGIMINALKHIRKQFEQAWRHGVGDPDDRALLQLCLAGVHLAERASSPHF